MERISHIADIVLKYSFIILSILVPLILTPVNYELFEYNKMMVTYGISAVVAFAWLSKMIVQKRVFVRRTPFDIPIGLFVLSQFVSTLFSMDHPVSWFGYYSRFNGGMLSILCYVLLFYAYVTHIPRSFQKTLLSFVFGSAIVVAIYGVLQHFGIDKHIWVQDVQARVFSTLGQPNWLAAYLVALMPIAFALTIIKHRKPVYLWTLLVATLFFSTLLCTKSRSGMIAFGIVDILFYAIVYIKSKRAKKIKGLALNYMPLVTTHIFFVCALFLFGTGMPRIDRYLTLNGLRSRPSASVEQTTVAPQTGPVLEVGGTESGVIRKYVWQGAINAWRATPKNMLIGTGTETFAFAFYQNKPIGHNLTSEWDFLYNKAHNEYLNFLTTTGIFGLGSYLVLIGSILYWVIGYAKKTALYIQVKKQPSQLNYVSLIVYALAIGWISLLITNFFGFSVVVTQLLFFLLPGVALVHQQKKELFRIKEFDMKEDLQWVILGSTVLLAIGIYALLGVIWYADKTFASGYRLSKAGQYANAYVPLKASIAMNRFVPMYHDEYAAVLSGLAIGAFESQDATLAGTLAVYSLTENDIALRVSPNNVNFWKTRTKIFYALATLDEAYLPQAIDALIHAETLSPMDPKISYNLAILYGKLGDSKKAVDYLLLSKQLKPNYRDTYYALFVFYNEIKEPDKAQAIIKEYLTTVDGTDSEFIKMVE